MRDLLGDDVEVLRVKATGADMATIEPAGLPAVRLAPLRKLRALGEIGDEELVGIERANLIDPAAPNPSVEIMLHAFLPHKFVDHTHATAVLSVIDQPDGEKKCAEVFGGRLGVRALRHAGLRPRQEGDRGFRAGQAERRAHPVSKHGIVTFGESAREAYERMIEMVSLAEEFIARRRKAVAAAPARRGTADARRRSRRSCAAPAARRTKTIEGAWRRLVLEFRATDAVLNFVNGKDLARFSQAGVVTPDHTIRTKNWPLVLPRARRRQT